MIPRLQGAAEPASGLGSFFTSWSNENEKDFADLTLALFNDDNLWQSMRNYLIKNRSEINWAKVAVDLIRQIND